MRRKKKMLGINKMSVAAIFSMWSKEFKEHQLVLLFNNNRQIRVRAEDAPAALEELGLSQFTDSWILNLAEDLQ